ncbi:MULTISPECIES: AAA family ATPase [Paenibacillus]|uniref:AAA family ATPase n=1 Tax=Paenibacillus TaxID=44249 RepID=UPI0022B879C9|nr:AAA family ATPase [Paenibacillus caseinilyticus]MCZ8521545.1 AAA family ATPase [Paenibacillus caseinilyticus]
MALNLNEGAAERLDETASAIWYRTEEAGGPKRLVKVLKPEYNTPREAQLLALELERGGRLSEAPALLLPIALASFRGAPALVTEETDGELLTSLLASSPMEPAPFLELALLMTDALRQLHGLHLAHTALSPYAFFVDFRQAAVRLTELHSLTYRNALTAAAAGPEYPAGADCLAYLAPELHGPTGAAVDYRTDLYSLGVLFHRMLTGTLPGGDRLHSKPAAPLNGTLGDILGRLLAPVPGERYQSAYALQRDLERCLGMLKSGGTIEAFAIGSADTAHPFLISETIYGRERELRLLREAYARCLTGQAESVFVSGLSGIGKSYLIHEFQKGIVQGTALFVQGKFDQYKRESPYYAIRQVGRGLLQHLHQLSPRDFEICRQRILQAVGPNGQILTEMNPDIEAVIGTQPPLPKLPPAEMHNRFVLTIGQYVSVFTSQEHPLVLFLDDLQWADPASLQLIAELLLGLPSLHLLFIGSYRDREVIGTHPLHSLLDKLGRSRSAPLEIRLEPLSESHIARLLEDTLRPAKQDPRELAGLMMSKTKGNPFFTKQYFRSLYDHQLLRFDQGAYSWEWDTERIKELHITDNVVDFMMGKIRRLSESMQHLLMHAACIGQQFTPEVLALVTGLDEESITALLVRAVDDSLFLQVGGGRREAAGSAGSSYKFMHDRVYQAVYSLLSEEDKQRIHLHTGRTLQALYAEEEHDMPLFEVTDQLNLGAEGIHDPGEKAALAQKNLAAARKAKGNSAYDTAYRYAVQGLRLLDPGDWASRFELMYSLQLERAELEYLCGRFDEAKASFDIVLRHSRTKLEKADVYTLLIILHTHIGDHAEAVRLGLQGLRLLGMTLSPKIGKGRILLEMFKSQLHLGLRSREDLLDHYQMTEPEHKAVMRFLVNLIPSAYFLNADLYVYLMLRMFNYSLTHGHSDGSAYAYSTYGVIVSALFGRLKAGWEYGRLSIQLSDMYTNPAIKSKVYFAYGGFSNNIREHIEANVGHLRKAYQYGVESGDLVYAGYSIAFSFFMQLLKGDTLPDVLQVSEEYREFVHKAQDRDVIWIYTVIQRFIRFMEKASQPGSAEYSASEGLLQPEEAQLVRGLSNKAVVHTYYSLQIQAFYLMNELGEALRMCEETEANLSQMFGFPHIEIHHFQYGMVLASLYESASAPAQKKYKHRIRKSLRILNKWADHSPSNYRHLHLLLRAEYHRILEQRTQAAEAYDLAVQAAARSRFLPREAMANERAAIFYLRTGRLKIARAYLQDARSLYERWGGVRKVAQLERLYPGLLGRMPEGAAALGADSVMKDLPALSHQEVFQHMLESIMGIVLENAGADKGVLLLDKDGRLHLEAEKSLHDPFRVLHSAPLDTSTSVPVTVVQYAARTGDTLLLQETPASGLFGQDPYIREVRPHSLLCLPVRKSGRIIGLLYLENRMPGRSFREEHFHTLKLLAAEVTSLIENTKWYAHLEYKDYILRLLQEQERASRQQLGEEAHWVQSSEATMQSIRKARHELIHRVQTVHALLTMNKYDAAKQFIADWCKELVQESVVNSVASPVLGVVLSQLSPVCLASQIDLQVDGMLECLFERMDLPVPYFSSIVHTLLRLAVEAVPPHDPLRIVRLTLEESDTHYSLAVFHTGSSTEDDSLSRIVPMGGPPKAEEPHPALGMHIVQNYLHHYGGEMHTRCEEAGTTHTILLRKQAASESPPFEAAAAGLDRY